MLLSICEVRDSKKLKCFQQQELIRLLSSLGIKISFSKILLVGPLLF